MERAVQLAFSMFGFRPAAFIGVALLILLPAHILIAGTQLAFVDDLLRVQQAQLDALAGKPIDLTQLLSPAGLAIDYLTLALITVVGFLAQAALVSMMVGVYRGPPQTVGGSVRAAFGRLVSLAGAALAVLVATLGVLLLGGLSAALLFLVSVSGGRLQPGPAVFGGLLVLVATIVLVVFLGVRWTFAAQAVMVDGLPARAALGRSWRLVSGSSWRVFGYTLLFTLITGVIAMFIGTVVAIFVGSGFRTVDGVVVFDLVPFLVTTAVDSLVSIALMPISVIGLTLIYFDLRHGRGEALPVGSVAE